ncbi:transposon ty3-G gag-pol polyprotein [Tanacetum coccineum]
MPKLSNVPEDDDEEPIGDTQEQTQDDSHAEKLIHAISGSITSSGVEGSRVDGDIWNRLIAPNQPHFDDNPPERTLCQVIQRVLSQFAKVFQSPTTLPSKQFQDHGIPLLPGAKPVSTRPYRQPYLQKAEIEKQVTLNDLTGNRNVVLPMIDELLDELHSSRFYSKLDLRSGYHQIRVRDEDIHKTAFKTHEGHYEFVVMPFGLTNAPATFQCLMNDLFRPYLRKFILVFFDDILIYSKTLEEHMDHLQVVLGILEANQLFAKASKCCFGVTQVNYLGHVISSDGVAVESDKIQTVLSWPTPTNAKGVRGFLGLAGYYRKFIKGFGGIAAPLHRLVGKAPFQWDESANQAFEDLKKALTTAPTLGLPNWSLPFTLECDASGVGIGAVLTQNGRPLAYFSAPLKGSMLSWSTYEKEMLAVVKAVRKWRHYLLGRPFVVKTDHMSLKYLLEQRLTTPAQAQWLPKLLGYDYKIEYKKGVSNIGADALSRRPECHFLAISHPCSLIWAEVQKEVRTTPYYSGLPSSLPSNSQKGVVLRDGKEAILGSTKPWLRSNKVSGWVLKERLKRFIRECSAQAQWLPKLLGYDYKIEYKKGVSNIGADALSRRPECHFLAISHPCSLIWAEVQKEVRTTPYYSGLPSSLPSNSQKGVVLRDGVWFREGAILLSPTSPLLPTVLEMCHSSLEGGHFGFHKTLAKVKQSFWWVGLKERLKRFIRECSVCQRFKTDSMKPTGLLQPLPIQERVWEDISMDFVEGLSNSNGFTAVMVVVDRLSKYAHFVPLRHPFTAATIAREFVSNIVRLHGVPSTVVSDRDKVFISSFWQALFKLQGTGLCMSSSYHPQSDGQTEVVNRTMEQYLRCFVGDKPKKWVEWLPWAEYSYNTSVHSSTKMTPFQVVYGRAPPKLIPYVPGTTNVQAVDEYLRDRDELLRQLRVNLLAAQHRMKIQADHHRRDLEFEVGDLVFVKLQPYRQMSVAFRGSNKLSPRFFGPYRVLGKVGPVAYRVELPPGSLIHDVFHVSLLRKCVGPVTDPIPAAIDVPQTPQPECILDERVVQKGKYRPKTELLVKWVGCPREDATWETKWRFARSYPNFRLEDKAGVSGVDCYVSMLMH